MQNFVKLSLMDQDGQEILVNTESIVLAVEKGGGVELSLSDGQQVTVQAASRS